MTPSERTLKYYRDRGYTVGRVERDVRIPPKEPSGQPTMFKSDLFGCLDYIAIKKDSIVGVQSTVDRQKQNHIDKILAEPRAKVWTSSGAGLHLICWRTLQGKWVPIVVVFDRDLFFVTLPMGLVDIGKSEA